MRIGLLCHRGFGGSARVAVDLGNALAARGHRVHLFSRTPPLGGAPLHRAITFHGLDRVADTAAPACARLDRHWSVADATRLTERVVHVATRGGLDVLHAHYADPFAVIADDVRRRCERDGPVVVTTLHGTDVTAAGAGPRRRRIRAALQRSHAVTTVSSDHADLARAVFRLPTRPDVIPNFIDVQRFRPSGRGLPSGAARVVHVSNFRPVKDVEAVARVFLRVRRLLPVELWLVGDGETRPAVQRLLRRAGVDGDVHLFGLQSNVDRILPQCDVLLMMSRAESFCLAALEASACGLPVVAPRVGGLPEVVVDSETGLLVAARDEPAAAAAVLGLLRDEQRRIAMGQAAARRAVAYSTDSVVGRYEALYARLVQRFANGGRAVGPQRRPVLEPVAE